MIDVGALCCIGIITCPAQLPKKRLWRNAQSILEARLTRRDGDTEPLSVLVFRGANEGIMAHRMIVVDR